MPKFHIIGNILLILFFFCLSFWLTNSKRFEKIKKRKLILLGVSFLLGFIGFYFAMRPDVFISFFPFADLIFYSNIYPLAVAFFIPPALKFSKSKSQRIRLGVWLFLLFLVSCKGYEYFTIPPSYGRDKGVNFEGICIQSDFDTCDAAAIVNLLHTHDIEVTEKEVAELAFTRREMGTTLLGEYRALKIILEKNNSPLKVKSKKISADYLLEKNMPAILTVGVSKNPKTPLEQEMLDKWNWDPGIYHAVVFFGIVEKDPKKVKIVDPSFGIEHWPIEHLRTLFQNYATYLE